MGNGRAEAVRGLLRHSGWPILLAAWREERFEAVTKALKSARSLKQMARIQATVAATEQIVELAERMAEPEDET